MSRLCAVKQAIELGDGLVDRNLTLRVSYLVELGLV